MNTSRKNSLVAAAFLALALSARARADLVPDPNFGVNGVVRTSFGTTNTDTPNDMLIQPDGRILVAGISALTFDYFIAMARYSADGVPDSSGFGTNGSVMTSFAVRDQANGIALQEDGKIVAVGVHAESNAGSAQIPSIYRFNEDGSVDTTFAGVGWVAGRYDGVSSGEHADVKVRPDGKILAAGRCNTNANGGVNGFGVKRFQPDGTEDLSSRINFDIDFNRGACVFPDDGGVIWANTAFLNNRMEYVMARADSAGNLDPTFGIRLTGIEAVQLTDVRLLLQADGKVLLAGTTPRPGGQQFGVYRFHADGSLDTGFGTNGGTNFAISGQDKLYDLAVDAAGRILLVGYAQVGWGQPALARLTPDGAMDSTFCGDGTCLSNLNNDGGPHWLTRVLILPNGAILGAGSDYSGSGNAEFFVVRYISEVSGVGDSGPASPAASLQAVPNPSRGTSTIRLELPREDLVRVSIFDVAGREVRRVFEGRLPIGTHALPWDGRDASGRELPAGLFLARVQTPGEAAAAKLLRVP